MQDRTRSFFVARWFAKMKDNIEFYVEFIEEVEKNPILYNPGLTDYSNRRITKIIWTKIGEKFNERGDDCKSKWKSIRSAYIRSLNAKSKSGSAARSKKEYYLAPYLLFLNPFTKNRPKEGNIPITRESERHIVDSEHESHTEDTSNDAPNLTSADAYSLKHEAPTDDLFVPSPPVSSSHSSSFPIQTPHRSKYGKPRCEADKCAVDYFTLKKKRLENKQQPETQQKDPCEMFLLSLVPHMTSMSQQQQLSFQRGVLELIENIKYPT